MKKLESLSLWYFSIVTLLLAGTGLIINYSLWQDELSSVASVSLPIKDLLYVVFHDVHPPLYFSLLKLWFILFGQDERSLRALSFIFSLLATLTITRFGHKKLSSVTFNSTMIFFLSSWIIPFFSQEVRSYALLLFFATLSTILYLKTLDNTDSQSSFLLYRISLFSLSLVHFYGLFYSGILILLSLYENRFNRIKFLKLTTTGILCLIWPLLHIFRGNLLNYSGKSNWIQSNGFQTSLYYATDALLPQITYVQSTLFKIQISDQEFISAFIVICLITFLYIYFIKNKAFKERLKAIKTLNIITLFLTLLIIIDYKTPMSFTRYYLILLPATSFLFGFFISSLYQKGYKHAFIITLITGLSAQYISANKISEKITPYENQKDAAHFLENKKLISHKKYYYAVSSYLKKVKQGRATFYLHKNTEITPVKYSELSEIKKPFCIFFQRSEIPYQKIIEYYRKQNIDIEVFYPKQASKHGSYVVYTL